MKKTTTNGSHHSLLTQVFKNTTSWIGCYSHDGNEKKAGQVFESPDEGDLDCIEVYSDAVPQPGKLMLTFHAFDNEKQTWGPVMATSEIDVNDDHAQKWIGFPLTKRIHLQKNQKYGFRLQSQNAFVAVGEAAWATDAPGECGQEWVAGTHDVGGHLYNHFSLAYKIEVKD